MRGRGDVKGLQVCQSGNGSEKAAGPRRLCRRRAAPSAGRRGTESAIDAAQHVRPTQKHRKHMAQSAGTTSLHVGSGLSVEAVLSDVIGTYLQFGEAVCNAIEVSVHRHAAAVPDLRMDHHPWIWQSGEALLRNLRNLLVHEPSLSASGLPARAWRSMVVAAEAVALPRVLTARLIAENGCWTSADDLERLQRGAEKKHAHGTMGLCKCDCGRWR